MQWEKLREDSEDLLLAAKSTLIVAKIKNRVIIQIWFANSEKDNLNQDDIAEGKIAALCLETNNKKYFLG